MNTKRVLEFTCTACGEACAGKVFDFGIGRGEFQGTPFNDIQREWVSDCCEAPMIDPETGGEADAPDDPRNEYAPEE